MKPLLCAAVAATLLVIGCNSQSSRHHDEHDIATLRDMMERGDLTDRGLLEYYLDKIDARDRSGPALNAIIELNPDVLSIADELDLERVESGPRAPSIEYRAIQQTGT